MHPDFMFSSITRKTLACVFVAAALAACGGKQAPTPTPAPVIVATPTPVPLPTLGADDAEHAYALAYFAVRDPLVAAAGMHVDLRRALERNSLLINDAIWRASVGSELALFRQADAAIAKLQPPENFAPANDAMITAATIYNTAEAAIEQSLAASDAQMFLDTQELMNQANTQLHASGTLYLGER